MANMLLFVLLTGLGTAYHIVYAISITGSGDGSLLGGDQAPPSALFDQGRRLARTSASNGLTSERGSAGKGAGARNEEGGWPDAVRHVMGVLGTMLFDAASMPFVLSVWTLLFGLGVHRGRDLTRSMVALALIFAALPLRTTPVTMDEVFKVAFMLGTIHFITALLVLEEDGEAEVKELIAKHRRQVAMPGTGLALGYFFNFVKPIAEGLAAAASEDSSNGGAAGIRVKLKGDGTADVAATLKGDALLHVLIPRDLPEGHEIKSEVGKLKGEAGFAPLHPGAHRPFVVSFFPGEPPASAGAPRELRGMFDIPTAIGVCYERRQNASFVEDEASWSVDDSADSEPSLAQRLFNIISETLDSKLERAVPPKLLSCGSCCARMCARWRSFTSDPVAQANQETSYAPPADAEVPVAMEITDFANALLGLIQRDKVARDHVRVWSVPPPPFDLEHLATLCRTPRGLVTEHPPPSSSSSMAWAPAAVGRSGQADARNPYQVLSA